VLTGTISRIFRQHLSNIPGKNDIRDAHTAAVLGIAHSPIKY
jgi:hypothetical protein